MHFWVVYLESHFLFILFFPFCSCYLVICFYTIAEGKAMVQNNLELNLPQVLPSILYKQKNSLTQRKKKILKFDYPQLPAGQL